jgi:hypothetical protein
MNVLGAQASAKQQKNVEKIQEIIHKDQWRTGCELADTVGISYGVFYEILTEIWNMCCNATMPWLLTNDKKRAKKCLELGEKAHMDPTFISRITLFPKLKMKLKEWHFEIMFDIQRKSQAVFSSIKENGFHGAFDAWTKWWNHCIHSQEDYFEEMAAKITLSHHFYFDLVWELSDSPSYFTFSSL